MSDSIEPTHEPMHKPTPERPGGAGTPAADHAAAAADPTTDAEIELLLAALPEEVAQAVRAAGTAGLIEVICDLGRVPTARYSDREVPLTAQEVTLQELGTITSRVSEFGEDNRAGIPRTLHRISAIRNRGGRIVGMTCRVGRSVRGSAEAIRDLVEAGHSVLLLGRPGVGKTTMLRETARLLADEVGRRVVIVDTSNEIGGDGDVPHHAIGRARRMQVRRPELQHEVMIEAVENHMPEVIVIDEIGTALEAAAARTIAERGVQLIGTAHGNTLANLMQNPTLSDLIGGIESVTLGDEEARRRGTQKTVLERRAPPTFSALVEIQSHDRLAVYPEIAHTVDLLLRGWDAEAELRLLAPDGSVTETEVERIDAGDGGAPGGRGPVFGGALPGGTFAGGGRPGWGAEGRPARGARRAPPATGGLGRRVDPDPPPEAGAAVAGRGGRSGPRRRILPFGVSRARLEQAIQQVGSPAVVVDALEDADCVMTLRPYYRRRAGPLREAEARGIPVWVLRNNTTQQIERQLLHMRGETPGGDPVVAALREAEDAIALVSFGGRPAVELSPQNAYVRRRQHELAARHGVTSHSRGREPQRRVVVEAAGEGGRAPTFGWLDEDSA